MLRTLVLTLLVSCGHAATQPARPARATKPAHPPVGAIRWDAWVGETPDVPGYDVGVQVERSLGPKHWHYRLPFFAQELSSTEVRVRGATQDVMDREIEYAKLAGLDYWAFCMYAPHDPSTRALDLYLRSAHRTDVRFAMIVQSYTFDHESIDRLVRYFALPEYQRVAGDRPLVFLLGPSSRDPKWPHAKQSVDELRAKTATAKIAPPYLVHQWGWDGAREVVDALGLDAESAYSMQFDDEHAPYATLAHKTEQKWDDWARAGAHVVPLVMTGWDRRPRVEHPMSWEAPNHPRAGERFYEAPAPAELGAHLRAALAWSTQHEAPAVLVYAWNEIDEGGWLVPSLWPDQGTQRLDALRAALDRTP